MSRWIFLLLMLSCQAGFSQSVEFYSIEQVERLKQNQSDTLYVINFWATWCKPCVEELPAFERLQQKYAGRKLKVILVSLDFKKQIDTRLIPFIQKNKLQCQVVWLNEGDPNRWIDRVSPDWQGAIPATLISGKSKASRLFFERSFTFEELENIVQPLIQ